MPQIIRLDSVTLAAIAANSTDQTTLLGALTETAPASDTASSGLNGRLQRVAQNLTTETAAVTANGVLAGAVNETAPASDTASSGLNGRLQRIAQRLTSLIALVPAALGKGVASGALLVTEALDNRADSTYRLLASLATTNGANIKASAGTLWKVTGNNTVAAKKYMKFYNKATAPTVGTDVPILTLCIPVSAAFQFDIPGRYFPLGLGIAITAAAADADTAAIGAGDLECINVLYR